MNLLHLDSSIQGEASASRAISKAVVERLLSADPSVQVTYRDLASEPLPHLTLDQFGGSQSKELLDEFLNADTIVIGTALYNFTIPTQLKAWIDRILIAGVTFSYGEQGPVGLAGGRRVIVALARGGVYGEGSPFAHFEHAETLLRGVLSFIGITDVQFIIAEGLARGEEVRAAALSAAFDDARHVRSVRAAA